MQEMSKHEMYLKEKQQFEYAKFCQFIDELDNSLFDSNHFNKEQIKGWLFNAINNNPEQGIAWGIDRVFNKIIQDSKDFSPKKLGALRLKLSEAISNNFKTKEFIFPAPKTTDAEKDIEMKKIKDDDQPENDDNLKLKMKFTETPDLVEPKKIQKADDVVLTKEVEYLPHQVDVFINKIPEQYFGSQGSSRENLAAFVKNRFIQLKKGEGPKKMMDEITNRIIHDISCPNSKALIDIFEIWLSDFWFNDLLDDDPIIRFTPEGETIKKLNLDQYQLVTFANFCNFVDQIEVDEKLISRSQLKEIFFDILRTNPHSPTIDLAEKFSLILYRTLHTNLQESGQSLGDQEFGYLNHLYVLIRDAAEQNFTITGNAFITEAEQKTDGPIGKLDKYQANKRQLEIADKIWEKDKDDDLPN